MERLPGLIQIARASETHDAHEATRSAMKAGAPVIFQGELRSGDWMGIADFLHRIDGESSSAPHHYEPWDTKLARSAKPYFILQLCAYADMLEAMQSHRPAKFGFVFGDGTETSFRTADFWHYYRRLKQSLETFHREWSADKRPDPSLDRSHGRWSEAVEKLFEALDHLSLVAYITRSQIVRLREAGIHIVASLAASTGAIPRMSVSTLETLRAQATMQVKSRVAGRIEWRLRDRDPERPRRGLALLPPPSPNDVFFDFEGFPYAPGGLEYLFGVVTVDSGTPVFRDWWAHDRVAEKKAFEQFVDWAYDRWQQDPSLHIYHYAAYEKTALCRLMTTYGTREEQVDDLLRNEVLVDLLPIVRQGTVIGTPSYSLKYVEHLYMPVRTEGVVSAGGSVVEYQNWIDTQNPAILDRIRAYNKVDCESTAGLRDWLLARQKEAGIEYLPPEPPKPKEVESSATVLAEKLLARAEGESGEAARITSLLAWLLEFHRREEKPWWWKFYDRMKATEQELYDDIECLAGLERTSTPPRPVRRSTAFEYRFDADQDTRVDAGDGYALAGTDKLKCSVERFVDRDQGLIELTIGSGKTLPGLISLIPGSTIPTKPLRESILRFVTRWAENPNCHPAIADLLARRAPRLLGDATLSDPVNGVRSLDDSTLCIQGPPGTGKTTIATEMILALIADGKRVGVVANGHQVVLNLMERIAELGDRRGINPRLVKVTGDDDHPLIVSGRMKRVESKEAADELAEGPLVIGGTAWAFARPELDGKLDYLFIEEAGQFSIANAVAAGVAAKNLVLLGDQMQLSQPTQGAHPGDSGKSALEYFLEHRATIPPELGVFLGQSHRMHPDVCRLISESYYDGRLHSAPAASTHRIIGGTGTSIDQESGVRFVPVDHDGCTQDSECEVDEITGIVRELLGCDVTVKGEPVRPMTIADILIVAPFNMQVRALKRRLGTTARIGTVDKFQGQEAPVVIVSMCASTLDDAPRGPAFLLSKNRLNVAISRAQALA
ncbi:MAG: TM0106 family RecB-like putative nuclease, partial [bacterium]